MTNRNAVTIVCIIYPVILCLYAVCLLSVSAESDFIKKSGDVIIGGLVGLRGSDGKCDELNYEALLTTEAMLYAIDEINSGRQLDLKATLGYEIRDTCTGAKAATLDLVPLGKRNGTLAAALGTLSQDKPDNVDSLKMFFIEPLPFLSCDPSTYIGEGQLDMKTLRTFAFHAVPSDRTSLRALVDVIAYFKWSYVSVVYTEDAAGQYTRSVFEEEAKQKLLCLGTEYTVPAESSDPTRIVKIVNRLKNDKNASVVVLLTSRDVSSRLITKASEEKVSKLVWLTGDASWESKPFVSLTSIAAERLFSVGSYARVLSFKTHLKGLGQSVSWDRNKWLLEMFTKKNGSLTPTTSPEIPATTAGTNATVPKTNSSGLSNFTVPMTPTTRSTKALTPCADPGKQECSIDENKLNEVEERLTEMAEHAACTLDAVFAVAHALAAKEKCDSDCPSWREFSKYFEDLSFKNPTTGHQVSFSVDGYLKEPAYQVYTYQKFSGDDPSSPDEVTKLKREVVGTWKLSASGEPILKIQGDKIRWNTDSGQAPTAQCVKPCPAGEFKARRKNRSDTGCCWQCLPCPEGSISHKQDSPKCAQCPVTYRPNSERTGCVKYLEDFVLWSDAGSLVMIFLMVSGMCFCIYVGIVLLQNRDSPVMRRVKNASLFILPFSLILFLIPIPLLSKPTEASCEGYRAFFILALGVPLAALIARSHALDRCFEEGQRNSCLFRVVVALIVILVHVIIIIIISVYLPSRVSRFRTDDPFTEYIECSMFSGFGFLAAIFYLLVITVIVSVMSMNELISDGNDAEVKWVSLCMFNWAALSFFYVVFAMGIPGKGKIFGMALVDILFAVNYLGCVYIPKWYIVVFQPERNQVDVSPWSAYWNAQNKVSERLSENKEESPVTLRRGLASTAKESGGGGRKDRGLELQQLMADTDV